MDGGQQRAVHPGQGGFSAPSHSRQDGTLCPLSISFSGQNEKLPVMKGSPHHFTSHLSGSCHPALTLQTDIWLVVRVPVLSEQMTEVQPRVSTEGRLLTIAFFFAIRRVPKARQVVMTAGRPVGKKERG